MRSRIHARRFSALHQASALLVLAVVSTACSNDVARFEQQLLTATSMTDNQHKIIKQGGQVNQAYPGDVKKDNITILKRQEQPALKVSKPQPLVSAVQSSALAPVAQTNTVADKVASAKRFIASPVESVKKQLKRKPLNRSLKKLRLLIRLF